MEWLFENDRHWTWVDIWCGYVPHDWKGLRGGMSVVPHRQAEANHKYMSSYDPEKPSRYITYLDANSLYSWSMIKYLPHGGFKSIDPGSFNLSNVRGDSEKDHILDVDLTYPKELHDAHNDYPYCCEHKILEDDMLSPYSKFIAKKHELARGKSSELISSLTWQGKLCYTWN